MSTLYPQLSLLLFIFPLVISTSVLPSSSCTSLWMSRCLGSSKVTSLHCPLRPLKLLVAAPKTQRLASSNLVPRLMASYPDNHGGFFSSSTHMTFLVLFLRYLSCLFFPCSEHETPPPLARLDIPSFWMTCLCRFLPLCAIGSLFSLSPK